jgi:hypothetical protein
LYSPKYRVDEFEGSALGGELRYVVDRDVVER